MRRKGFAVIKLNFSMNIVTFNVILRLMHYGTPHTSTHTHECCPCFSRKCECLPDIFSCLCFLVSQFFRRPSAPQVNPTQPHIELSIDQTALQAVPCRQIANPLISCYIFDLLECLVFRVWLMNFVVFVALESVVGSLLCSLARLVFLVRVLFYSHSLFLP